MYAPKYTKTTPKSPPRQSYDHPCTQTNTPAYEKRYDCPLNTRQKDTKHDWHAICYIPQKPKMEESYGTLHLYTPQKLVFTYQLKTNRLIGITWE